MLTLKQKITPSAEGRYRLTTTLAVHPPDGDRLGTRVLLEGARVDLADADAAVLLRAGAVEHDLSGLTHAQIVSRLMNAGASYEAATQAASRRIR